MNDDRKFALTVMGGKLFNLGRISCDQYLETEAAVRKYLDRKVSAAAYRIPRYYATKPDFGDKVCPTFFDGRMETIKKI